MKEHYTETPADRKYMRSIQRNYDRSTKVKKVMHEYKHGELHSGSKKGPVVKNRSQAVAIALSSARKSALHNAKVGQMHSRCSGKNYNL